MNSYEEYRIGHTCNNVSVSTKSRRKSNTENSRLKLVFGVSEVLGRMSQRTTKLMTFQVAVSVLVLVQCVVLTQGSPSPGPVMANIKGDVYSLFPHEDLQTGQRSYSPEDDLKPIRERNFRSDPYFDYRDRDPYSDRDGRNSRYRDDFQVGLRRISNYRITRPLEKYNQILFDDERLNYPAVRERERDRYRDLDYSRYRDRDSGYYNSYRDRDLPYDKHRLRFSYLPGTSPRHLSVFRGTAILQEPRNSPRAYPPGHEPPKARIHVFDPASKTFSETKPGNLPNVKPGRLLIPGYNSGSQEEPGPNVFLNHEEYLDFHTKKALAAMDKNGEKGESESEKKDRAKHLLFSPNIGGLKPPVPNSSSGESNENESGDGGGEGKPELRTQKVKGVVIKPLSEPTPTTIKEHKSVKNEEGDQIGQKQTQPTRVKGIISPAPRSLSQSPSTSSSLDVQQSKGIKSQSPTDVPSKIGTSPADIQKVFNDQKLNQQIVGNFISSTINPNSNTFFSTVDHSGFTPGLSTPTFTPTNYPDFAPQRFHSEGEAPPLIFLESQDGRTNIGDAKEGNGNNNMIFVRRVKGQGTSKSSNSTQVKSSGVKNSGHEKDVETTMKVHKSQVDSKEGFNDFNLQEESTSKTGVVSKVKAHISNCPKLHGSAEVICDIHIRKRHGILNPQLTVGWKRKFHNATQPDIILALNKTLAYEEDFHDKFNVTLAPGISPMLRSVLLIRHVAPPDTGNYQCEVSDGENFLKSDTLLFLCH